MTANADRIVQEPVGVALRERAGIGIQIAGYLDGKAVIDISGFQVNGCA